MVPSTVVTVKPQQTAGAQFDGMTAGLHFYLDLGFFGSIDFDKTFFSIPKATLAIYDSDDSWDSSSRRALHAADGHRLRARVADDQARRVLTLARGRDFPTFLTNVSACLADETPAPELKEPCTVPPDNGAPPKVNVCLYGPSLSLVEKLGSMQLSLPSLPQQVCASPGSWPSGFGLTDELKACFASYLHLLCQPVSKQQLWEGQSVVSHVWNFDADFGCGAQERHPAVPIGICESRRPDHA